MSYVGIDQSVDYLPGEGTYPNGCHVCEVVVDAATGVVRIERYSAVDDFGRVINPMIVDGQLHVGIAQGVGQALLECCVYDTGSGQLFTGWFLDYTMTRDETLPALSHRSPWVPCTPPPTRIPGSGEAVPIRAPPLAVRTTIEA